MTSDKPTFTVRITELSRAPGDDEETGYSIRGFPSLETAREFARRFVRDSLEELRAPNQTRDELRRLWFLFGEDASVEGTGHGGSSELDFFIDNPATPEERDWVALRIELFGG